MGHIGVLDFDVVEVSNLHRYTNHFRLTSQPKTKSDRYFRSPLFITIFERQIIHDTRNEGMKKCLSAIMRMKVLNDSIKYTALDLKLSAENAFESFVGFDVIVDATDNFQARYFHDNS